MGWSMGWRSEDRDSLGSLLESGSEGCWETKSVGTHWRVGDVWGWNVME